MLYRNRQRRSGWPALACALWLIGSIPALAQPVTWTRVADTTPRFSQHNAALFRHGSGALFAGTTDFFGYGDYGGSAGLVYRSTDGGVTWTQTPFEGTGVTDFATDPGDDLLVSALEGLYRSSDLGETWSEIPTEQVRGYFQTVAITADGTIYLGIGGVPGLFDGGVFSSMDEGQSWTENDVSGLDRYELWVNEFAMASDGSLLAATYLGIIALQEPGQWVPLTVELEGLNNLAIAPDGVVFAANVFGGGIYRSTDGGTTWDAVSLPALGEVFDLLVDDRGHLLVSAEAGLYGSDTGGESLERLGEGIGLLLSAPDDHLISAGRFDGLYRSTSTVRLATAGPVVPGAITLHGNYPNPFTEETHLRLTLAEQARVRLDVVDVLGRRVAVLVDATLAAGEHTLTWEAAGMAPGVYFLRLHAGGLVKTQAVMLVH